jgi:hypothetical protein
MELSEEPVYRTLAKDVEHYKRLGPLRQWESTLNVTTIMG